MLHPVSPAVLEVLHKRLQRQREAEGAEVGVAERWLGHHSRQSMENVSSKLEHSKVLFFPVFFFTGSYGAAVYH